MNKVFITGTSRGLGKALAENYLSKGDIVVGLSRGCSIQHPNYTHYIIDLSNKSEVINYAFSLKGDFEKVILINNAGSLGEIKYIGEMESKKIAQNIQLNIASPMMLINQFVKAKCNQETVKYVLNIGSGAGSSPIDGWGLYCASKSAIEMFNKVYQKENEQKPRPTFMRTITPGVIDTAMQDEIRNADENYFSALKRFVEYKNNQELHSADEVAERIISNFDSLFKNEPVIQSIRNY